MKILLKNTTIIDPESSHHLTTKDILIEQGEIKKIESSMEDKADKIFDKVCISQGWADSSVCFGEPGYEQRETLLHGMEVAAKSGFTQVMLNPNTFPITDTKQDVAYIKQQTQNCVSEAHPIGALTKESKGEHLAELFDMRSGGAVAFGDYKRSFSNANLLKIALQYTQNFQGVVVAFPLDASISGKGVVNEHITSTKLGLKGIPTLSEYLCVARDLKVLEYCGGKLHIPTISCEQSVKLIKEAKEKGLDVTCSVAIHNLHFTDEVLEDFDTNYKVMPPLRDLQNVKALREALLDGTIDFVTSDHCPLDIEEKFKEFDYAQYGTIGLESAYGILRQYTGREKAVELLTKAKKRFDLPSFAIEKGNPVNITIFDDQKEFVFSKENILSSSKNSAFIGEKMKGQALGVITQKGSCFIN